MLYNDLTDQQKEDLHRHEIYIRGNTATLMGVFKDMDTSVWFPWITNNIDPILTSLTDPTDVIPDTSLLAGSSDLTVEEYKLLKSLLNDMYLLYVNNQALVSKAIGINS